MTELLDQEKLRYDRQLLLTGWGEAGQLKVKSSTVFIAGAGGLGSPVATYLAVAGVGRVRLCDADRIELSNLNRQFLHPDDRLGQLKAASAEQTLQALNPAINVTAYPDYLDEHNVASMVGGSDIVVDCLDNYETRYLLNRYCLEHDIPFVHGAIWGLSGQVSFLHPPETPCLRCLAPVPPPKEKFPAVGATSGLIGSIQAMEVLKHLTGIGETLKGTLLLFDGEEMSFMPIAVKPAFACPDCSPLHDH